MAEVFATSLSLCRPGQPNLVLEAGGTRRAAFQVRQLFIQKLRQPQAALRPLRGWPVFSGAAPTGQPLILKSMIVRIHWAEDPLCSKS